jgi:hypothetical protein
VMPCKDGSIGETWEADYRIGIAGTTEHPKTR